MIVTAALAIKGAFGAGEIIAKLRISTCRGVEGSREGLEGGFAEMVVVASADAIDMNGHRSGAGNRPEEFAGQRKVHALRTVGGLPVDLDDRHRAAGEIQHGADLGLVHRYVGVTVTVDAALIANGFRQGFADHDPGIFHRVVLVDVQVAFAMNLEVKAAVHREGGQHVIKETNAGVYVDLTGSIEVQLDLDVGLFGFAFSGRDTCSHERLLY